MTVDFENDTKLPSKHGYDGDYANALAELRSGINQIDKQLISLVAERFSKISEVGDLKAIFHQPVEDSKREHWVLDQALENAKRNGVSEFLTRELMDVLLKHSKATQAKRVRGL
ncbi:chorismate mutase [Pseudoalteromonas luteoviolacea]|uniref:chorismate mutase n=1 Tax=Pseudoalteromonas luteoviolacea TaxID=43657 RepID=UPI001B3A5123|nr:chorismate mutase [Pseudoalteromonas luteoviolacea]MBQ4878705.1 chorismate mutase [Pseudoalteromonas luteoviolacea]MBQ4907245.1 chorismate mutase [Pseudoalteromonas luteoviolacea]